MTDGMSSPSLPSPSKLTVHALKVPPGSRKAPIPVDAPSGFLSAMRLVTKDQLQPDYITRTRELSKTPSLDDSHHYDPSEAATPNSKGKLKKPTKKATLSLLEPEHTFTDAVPDKARNIANSAELGDQHAVDSIPAAPALQVRKRGRPKKSTVPADAEDIAPVTAKRPRKKLTIPGKVSEEVIAAPKRVRNKAAKVVTVNEGAESTNSAPVFPETERPARPRSDKLNAPPNAKVVAGSADKSKVIEASTTETVDTLNDLINGNISGVIDHCETAVKENKGNDSAESFGPRPRMAPAATAAQECLNRPIEESTSNLAEIYTKHSTDATHVLDAEPVNGRRLDSTPPTKDLPPSFQNQSFYEIHDDTPPRDDVSVDAGITGDVPQISAIEQEQFADVTLMQEGSCTESKFANLVGNFAYQHQEGEPSHRVIIGNPGVDVEQTGQENGTSKPEKKKRQPKKRAEPKESKTPKEPKVPKEPKAPKPPKAPRKKAEPKPKVPKEPKEPKVKVPKVPKTKISKEPKPKKPKAPPKKPLTITALATAAYRPPVLPPIEGEDSTKLTSYFTHEDTRPLDQTATMDQADMAPPRTTKRKSTAAAKTPSKRSKKAEAAAAAALQYKLESPETARQNMRNQDWLFGTSSQLAGAESPTEFRDLQRAMKESEDFVSSQGVGSSQAVDTFLAASRMRVPSAPHGTDLSLGQGQRDLWLSAARDHDANVFAGDEGLGIIFEGEQLAFAHNDDLPMQFPTELPEATQLLLRLDSVEVDKTQDSDYVDVDNIPEVIEHREQLNEVNQIHDENISTVTSEVADAEVAIVTTRAILKTLDPNSSMTKPVLDINGKISPTFAKRGVSPLSSQAPPPVINLLSPAKRSVGRPRKTVTDVAASTPKRSVGRPRKTSTDLTASPKRPVGRPPKSIQPFSDPAPRSPERATPRKKPLTQLPILSSSPYLDIDDISDAEATQSPPSPPRRRRSKSPTIQPTLEISNPAAVPPVKPRSDKQLQAAFPEVSKALFPKITEVVKAQPATTNIKHPSWWEKMLLYDPIVLEDLTYWLNQSGVRIESERVVALTKKKGGKKKGAEMEEMVEGIQETRTELVQEELRPWMVQKWCEENSICCLWKEGLRGGVRQKY